MLGAYDVYATQLYQLNQGLPLWEPEPTHNGHALLGDVGFVQEGRFYRFFNTLRPANDDANRFGVPEGFRPLVLPSYLIHRTENALSQGPICSRTIRALQVGASVSITGMGFSFRCCEDQGAVLMLNDRADREIVLRNDIMHKYMIEHHDAWYQFARNTLGLAIKQEDIIFVRGLLQTSDWAGVAGFLQEGRASTLSFDAGSVAPFSVAFSVAALKEISAPIQWRTGPRRDGDLKKDQTLFLQFYKLKKRIILGPRVVKAASEPRDMKPSSSDDHDIARILADEGAESSDEELVEIVPARRQVCTWTSCIFELLRSQ
ncbi:hypothetical protein OBBRIDRAFT_724385 [Obba rivulosa]|uniref:Uncharacterized protein n=1 Tax=Obba rivulosa TaxID=1052685 RepID=A0A8E2DQ35_9APHY|nr:hypothetical protein OBBRIDRAFT_724385 [Obba rivulosa]